MQAETTIYFVVWWVLFKYSSFGHFPYTCCVMIFATVKLKNWNADLHAPSRGTVTVLNILESTFFVYHSSQLYILRNSFTYQQQQQQCWRKMKHGERGQPTETSLNTHPNVSSCPPFLAQDYRYPLAEHPWFLQIP